MRFLRPFTAIAALIVLVASCKKDSNSIDTTPWFYFPAGGASNFANNLILFSSSDTVTYNMVISSTYLLTKDVTITLSVEDSARQSYNAANGTNYQLMPSSAYSFQTTIIAPKNSVYDTIPLKLNKQLLEGGDYMLPVVITSISDFKLDTSRRVLYLHTSANLLAGIYASSTVKTLYNGDAANNNVNETDTFSLTKSIIPTSVTESLLDYAELGHNGWKYILTYESGIFSVKPNDVIQSSIQSGSFSVTKSTFDPFTKKMYIKSSYKNLSGDERIVKESLTLQQ